MVFHKARRPFGAPVADPKPHPLFEPPPPTNLQNLNLPLGIAVPGEEERVTKAGKLVFHMVGDTGGIHGTSTQEAIATQMESHCTEATDADRPAFF
jgi:hypothetical protein